ncbi:hypothetical protein D0T84_02095 [Dysgonomonas sp. 521]|uniref:hypothetical protein n=1 Tax=Dysgonomonas sp. 521 TaxID=2302932 RepID=UPI0013D859C0|nr:hypothetical protein [Dysgonomonas sp. 521]NDV93709.1 hypothetical protein [Dysgonomonas sp. 521]
MIYAADNIEKTTKKLHKSFKANSSYEGMNEDIDFIFSCALHKKQSVWYTAVDELFWLATVSVGIQSRMLDVMKRGKAHEKFNITCSALLKYKGVPIDRDFIKQILELAIIDKSKRVKIFGAQVADKLNFYELADLIKTEMENATDEEVKECLSQDYIFLTKGYYIEKKGDRRSLHYRTGFRSIDENIEESRLHEWVLEELKDYDRMKDLYFNK